MDDKKIERVTEEIIKTKDNTLFYLQLYKLHLEEDPEMKESFETSYVLKKINQIIRKNNGDKKEAINYLLKSIQNIEKQRR